MKNCNRPSCKQENPQDINNFFRDRAFKDGRRPECKSCKKSQQNEWRFRNKEKWNAYMRKYNAEHPLSKKDKLQIRQRVLRCRYGLSIGEYDERLKKQNNQCLVCQKHTSELRKPLIVDHCHKTGLVRGLLCFSCNRSIAILDKPVLLERALSYIAL